ncbi:pyruvate kinase [Jonesia denitrificans]|uniref:Pyruvate kinase n=1 Tax=Jonesia denitrificans (strain ATCC 14870 / DSM 20603 / BCRC 15368 / CIP 55.134 / JCM 11481 / NBRC 15587 / NCTC 10816 / Prevot 55134) TaxID=471856 RepID=C7R420_JONDD|nr:pyruvate kinase [Jonesia denitrificans]ACV08877.1 pyruvate kinase [Jonesia denitrificans DSM 20603]ASE09806.1 pyruvate kinase [Jonesia denitrificans]QXB44343.1 pyruvate kinase [Jonesia denitrificans]SQH20879.1 Pyruvate kinase [Jonesia denitrificans]
MRKAKIVCTIGPATSSPENMLRLVNAGMDVARINRSHGGYEEHEAVYRNIRAAAEEAGRNVAVLVDLQGPKIRLGKFEEDRKYFLEVGDIFTITTDDILGNQEICSTTHKGLPQDARVGDPILIDDGKVTVRVIEVEGNKVVTKCEVPGPLSNNKGLNLPGVAVSVPAMSDKDEDDLRWAIRLGADIIALSFVRSARDYDDVRKVMEEEGRILPVVAKVEKPQAVDNLAEIVDAFDAIMVARGDLGVELPLEQVPLVQKRAVELARRAAKPVIVATQVLESMISSPRPTRAEASDCANAILDGADAVMLSGETSVGDFPIEAVETMAKIVEATEELGRERIAPLGSTPHTRGGAITRAAAEIGETLGVKYIVTFTQSGDSARRFARLRSPLQHLAFTPRSDVRSVLALSWGVTSRQVDQVESTDAMVRQVDAKLQEDGLAESGDLVVVVSGAPVGVSGTTNSILVHRIGDDI